MGYQSFGSKTSIKNLKLNEGAVYSSYNVKKWTPASSQPYDKSGNSTYRNQYTPSDFKLFNSNIMHSSIQEFLEETKSIEEDLKKLKQLSVEK